MMRFIDNIRRRNQAGFYCDMDGGFFDCGFFGVNASQTVTQLLSSLFNRMLFNRLRR